MVDLAAATTGLAIATAGCALLVGCAAIPQFTAAVILCSAAIVASVAAMAIGAASFIPQIAFVAAVIAVGITVGVSASQTVDLAEIRRIAQKGYAEARASTAQARADYNQALSNTTVRRGARTLAYNNLVQAARNVISGTNAASVPFGTTPLNALDPQIAAFVAATDAKNEAEFNVETSKEAVKTARRDVVDFQQALADTRALAVANPTNTEYPERIIELQKLVDEKNAALAAAVAAEAAAPGAVTAANNALTSARNALIAAGNRPYCVNSNCSLVFAGGGSLNTASFQYLIADADYAPDAKRLLALKRAVDEAEAAEEQSRLALEQVNALSTGTPPTGTETQLWAGAAEILRAADAKGGSK